MKKVTIEPRNINWFSLENYKWAEDLKITFVSIDSPNHPCDIMETSRDIYLGFHGREE